MTSATKASAHGTRAHARNLQQLGEILRTAVGRRRQISAQARQHNIGLRILLPRASS